MAPPLGVIAALIPGALLGELFKALTSGFPYLGLHDPRLSSATNTFVGFAIGGGGYRSFRLQSLETITVGMTTMLAGGSLQFLETGLRLRGRGHYPPCVTDGRSGGWRSSILAPTGGGLRHSGHSTLTVIVAGGLGHCDLPSMLYPHYR